MAIDSRVGIVSDTHGNTDRLTAACERFERDGIHLVLHAGDINTERVIDQLVGFDCYFVLGNADYDEQTLRGAVRAHYAPDRIKRTQIIEVNGASIALTHGHTKDLDKLIESGEYDYVVHGHTHVRRDEMRGETRIINPGALGGLKPQTRSYAILDVASGKLDWVELP